VILESDSIFEIRAKAKRGVVSRWDVFDELYVRGWPWDLAQLVAKHWTMQATGGTEAS
jgi:hypothetical protein